MQAANDQLSYPSWIIGAAVVNAFYSPNRNQIGMSTPSPPAPTPPVPKVSLH